MSVIDERIVRLTLDNQLFQKNVATSIGTLEKLKAALKFTEVGVGVKNVSDAFNNLRFDKLAGNVESVSNRFSMMGIAGMTVIQDLTRAAERLGSTLISSTFGQIKSGGWSRATNIDKAKFAIEGLGYVFEDLDGSISNAVNDTRFGYDEAATAASQLVASNVAIGEEMDNALKSIANVASQTNSSYSDIAHIYTTIAGNGKLMTEQLNQFSYRGMNAASMLGKVLNKSEAEIREMTTKGKIDFKTFSDAMNEYLGEGAKRANETFEGSLANMKAALSRIGQPFAEVIRKYAVPVFNNLKEVIKTVKTYLDQLVEPFDDFMAKASNFSVTVLQNIDLSPLQAFIDKIREAYMWFDVFMTTVNPMWKKAEEEQKAAVESAKETEDEIEELAKKVIAGEYGFGEENRRKALEAENHSFELVQNKVNELLGSSKRYEVAEEDLTEAVEENNEATKTSLDYAQEGIKSQTKQVKEAQRRVKEEERRIKIQEAVNKLAERFKPIAEGARSAVHILHNTIGAIIDGGFNPMVDILTNLGSIILDVLGGIGKFITKIDELLTKIGFYDKLEKTVNGLLTDFSNTIGDIAKNVSEFVNGDNGLSKFLEALTKSAEEGEKASGVLGPFGTILVGLMNTIKEFATSDGPLSLQSIVDLINEIYPSLSKIQPILNSVYGNLVGLSGAQTVLSLLWGVRQIPNILNSIAHQNNSEAILNLAKAFGIFAGVMFLFSMMSWERIEKGIVVITALSAALGGLWVVFTNFSGPRDKIPVLGTLENYVNSLANGNNANSILKLSGAVAIMAGSFWLLSTIPVEGMKNAATAITIVTTALAGLWLVFSQGTNIINRFANGVTGMVGNIFNTIDAYVKAEANDKNATAILKLAGAIAIVAASMYLLGHLKTDELKNAAIALGIVTVAIIAVMAMLNHINRTSFKWKAKNPITALSFAIQDFAKNTSIGLKKIGNGIMIASIAALVLAIGSILKQLASMDPKTALISVGIIGLVFLELFGALFLISKFVSVGFLSSMGTASLISSLSSFIKGIGGVLQTLASIPFESGLKACVFLGIVLAELWLALMAITGVNADKTRPIKLAIVMMAIGSLIKSVGKTLKALSNIPLENGIQGCILLGAVLAELWLALMAITGVDASATKPIKMAIVMFAISMAVNSLGKTIKTLSEIPFERALAATIALGLVMLELAAVVKIISGGQFSNTIGDAALIASIGLAVGLMGASIWILSKIDAADLAKALMAITAVGTIFLAIMGLGKLIGGSGVTGAMSSFKSILPMIAMLLAITASLWLISNIDTEKLEASVNALGKVLLSIATVFGSMSLSTMFGGTGMGALTQLTSFLGIAGIILEIAGVFYLLQDLDADHMIGVSEALSKFIKAISMLSIAAAAVSLSGGGLMAVGSIAGVVGAITAIETIAALIEHFSGGAASKNLAKGFPLLETIARGIGRFFGVLLEEGLLKPLHNTFGDMPKQFTDFITTIGPALEGMQDLDSSGLDQLKDIMKKIVAIQAEGLIASVLKFLSGENSLQVFASDMVVLAKGLNDYCKELKKGEFDKATVESTTEALTMLTDLADAIPDDGFFSKLLNQTDVRQFGEDLAPLAEGLNSFCEKLSTGNFNKDVADKGAAAAKVLAAFAKEVPDNSLIEKIAHLTDFEVFIEQLPDLGTKLAEFTTNLTNNGFDKDAATLGARAGSMLANFAAKVPSQNLLDKLLNNSDLQNFVDTLPSLGMNLAAFCDNLKNGNFDQTMVDRGIAAAEVLAGFAKECPDSSLIEKILGITDLETFSRQLPTLAEGLAGFTTTLTDSGFDPGTVRSSKGAISILASLANDIPDVSNGILGWFTEGKLENFGSQLEQFANGLAAYATIIGGIANDDIEKSTSAVKMVNSLLEVFNTMNGTLGSTVGYGNAQNAMDAIYDTYDIAEAVSGFFSDLATAFEGQDEDINSLHETLKNVGANISGWIVEGLNQSTENGDPVSTMTAIGKSIAEGLADDSTLEDVKTNAQAIGEIILDGIIGGEGEEGFIEQSSGAITESIEIISGVLSDYAADMSSTGSSWGSNLASGLRSKVGVVKLAASAIASAALNSLRASNSSFNTVGSTWGSRIASGISSSTSTVRANATTLGTTAGTAFSNAYTIAATPPTAPPITTPETEAEAEDTADKAGKGVADTFVDAVDEGIAKKSSDFTSTVAKTVAYANAVMNEAIDTNPVITPVLDMSNVQAGAGLMNSYLNDTFAISKGATGYTSSLLSGVSIRQPDYGMQNQMNALATQEALNGIRQDIKDLGESMSHMQMVMNNGALVGQIGRGMDKQLGSIQKFKERWA